MPSSYESWGRVAIEAACSGIPTIAHPTDGLLEALGPAGIFVDRRKTRQWQAELERLDDPDQYAKASVASEGAGPRARVDHRPTTSKGSRRDPLARRRPPSRKARRVRSRLDDPQRGPRRRPLPRVRRNSCSCSPSGRCPPRPPDRRPSRTSRRRPASDLPDVARRLPALAPAAAIRAGLLPADSDDTLPGRHRAAQASRRSPGPPATPTPRPPRGPPRLPPRISP
jgi:hypothetical protein